jgi:ribulose-5-phosphate 4-epimerase/fuculose-1-phosphate aldolase
MYDAEKTLMLDEIQRMLAAELLDRLGGSLSLRTSDNRILATPNTAAFRRWRITRDEIVVLDADGELIEGGPYKAAAAAPLFTYIYRRYPEVGAIAHSHCLYSLVYASAGLPIPAATVGSDILGEIPCMRPEEPDLDIKTRELQQASTSPLPSGYSQRGEVYAVNERLGPMVDKILEPRRAELKRHGIAYSIYRHGIVVVARHLEEATENIERVETSAKVAYLKSFLESDSTKSDLT